MEDLLKRYFEYVNNDAFDQLMELWHEDGEFNMPLQKKLTGKAEIRKFYETMPKVYAEHEDDPYDFIMGDNKVAIRIAVKNKTHDGKMVDLEALSWMTFEDGKIKSANVLYDSAKALKALKG
ncbi:nuclear transport factor 2 family protein [Thermodesulfobacteriota bacterium]